MSNTNVNSWQRFAALFALQFVLCVVSPVLAAEVSILNQVVGRTPGLVGYNSGHFMPGSNTADWWRYSGVNAARIWATPGQVENGDDNGIQGDGVTSPRSFLDRRAALRADPLNTSFINWQHFENGYQSTLTGSNQIQLDYALNELRQLGVTPLVVIHRTDRADPWSAASTEAGWGDRWEYWQHYYAQAFYLAQNYDVERFQMFNEPNHGSNDISQADYVERLQFASDAVQSAVADVNALFGKSLVAQMQGPVTAGGTTLFSANPGGDPRDDTTGWGELILQNQHTNVLGNHDPTSNLIQTYAYQQYNAAPTTFGNEVNTFRNLLSTTPGGENLRLAITEFNVHTAGVFDTMIETIDSPSKIARWGAILSNLANSQPDELYVFKFSQTTKAAGGIAKNGMHFVDNDSADRNIGDSTTGAEIVRLFAKGFAGAQNLLATPAVSGTGASDLSLAAAHNPTKGVYSILSANSSTTSRPLNLDLNALGIPLGSRIVIEEVSQSRHGEVHSMIDLTASGLISLTQPAESVFLITVPETAPAYSVTLGATDDAMVKSGANSSQNYGTSQNLFAKNHATNANARNVSFIKFDAGDIDTAGVDQAILRVVGENTGSAATVITQVYGIANDDWDETTINWDNAPNLAAGLGSMDDISHNFIEDIGGTATIVGHLTGTSGENEIMLDVTSFVRDHPDSDLTFLVARVVRYDGEDVDDALTSLRLASKERGNGAGPQLILSLNKLALPGDYNSDGFVDAADYTVWRDSLGSTGVDLTADGNGDELVDAADYHVWRSNYGNSLMNTASTSGLTSNAASVPEPSALPFFALLIASIATWLARQGQHAPLG